MRRIVIGTALAFSMQMGCKTITKKDMMVGSSKVGTDKQMVWHRPTEVYHEFMNYCQGESSTSRLFGFIRTAGDPAPGGLSLNIFGSMGSGLDANGTWAASRAIDGGSADGLYVLRTETEKSVVFPIWTKRTFVKGKCLQLKALGPVSKERDALGRFGHAPDSTGFGSTPK